MGNKTIFHYHTDRNGKTFVLDEAQERVFQQWKKGPLPRELPAQARETLKEELPKKPVTNANPSTRNWGQAEHSRPTSEVQTSSFLNAIGFGIIIVAVVVMILMSSR